MAMTTWRARLCLPYWFLTEASGAEAADGPPVRAAPQGAIAPGVTIAATICGRPVRAIAPRMKIAASLSAAKEGTIAPKVVIAEKMSVPPAVRSEAWVSSADGGYCWDSVS